MCLVGVLLETLTEFRLTRQGDMNFKATAVTSLHSRQPAVHLHPASGPSLHQEGRKSKSAEDDVVMSKDMAAGGADVKAQQAASSRLARSAVSSAANGGGYVEARDEVASVGAGVTRSRKGETDVKIRGKMAGSAGSVAAGRADAAVGPAASSSHVLDNQQEQKAEAKIRALTLQTIREMRQKMKADLTKVRWSLNLQSEASSARSDPPAGAGAGSRARAGAATGAGSSSAWHVRHAAGPLVNRCDLWGCETTAVARAGPDLEPRARRVSRAPARHDAIRDAHYNVRPMSLDSLSFIEDRGEEWQGGGGGRAKEHADSYPMQGKALESARGGGGRGGWWDAVRQKSTAGLQQTSVESD